MSHPVHHIFVLPMWKDLPPDIVIDDDGNISIPTNTWYRLESFLWSRGATGKLYIWEEEPRDWKGDEIPLGKALSEYFPDTLVFLQLEPDSDLDTIETQYTFLDGKLVHEWHLSPPEPPGVEEILAELELDYRKILELEGRSN